ncbi:hypothetical protein BGZ59_011131 [Podila verticillata]|nr:hypothetical protein BGZ59_011131 [Podila verticillata]KFH67331.1 hypothetical protein MVEG_06065 [Podila verticillata NRRL 6337]
MLPKKSIFATLLAMSHLVAAGKFPYRVFLEQPANGTNIYPGCPFTLGYRVQFSDMAMLRWVQLQLLDQANEILVESIDNTTRAEWHDVRGKNLTWTVPSDWTPGDYIVRAFGNATYPCTQEGHRTMCSFPLEDRETLHLLPLTASQGCPSGSEMKDNTTGASRTLTSNEKGDKKISEANTTLEATTKSPEELRIRIDQAAVQWMQDQEVYEWIASSRDVDMANKHITLMNGTVVAISDLMDPTTAAKLVATLEASNSGGVNTTTLLEMMHQNTSMIVVPSEGGNMMNETMAIGGSQQGGFTINPNGTSTTEPQRDLSQVQDKTKKSMNGAERVGERWGVIVGMVSVAMAMGW